MIPLAWVLLIIICVALLVAVLAAAWAWSWAFRAASMSRVALADARKVREALVGTGPGARR
jgi:hypothetical protein